MGSRPGAAHAWQGRVHLLPGRAHRVHQVGGRPHPLPPPPGGEGEEDSPSPRGRGGRRKPFSPWGRGWGGVGFVMLTGEVQIRVRYAETDRMGLLHHANYLIYFEQARTELLRDQGRSYKDLEDAGFLLVLTKIEVRYKQ